MTSLWERVKVGSKTGFDKTWKALDKVGAPVNRLSNKLGAEAFWPTTLDKECDKAARILKSFCKDGFYSEEEYQPTEGPKQAQKVIKKIPASVIRNAKGLAIFTTMRTGLWFSGAGGSGILIARKDDGSWSPPSGILLHTAGLGFMVGIDIYDCVVVINSEAALEAFYKVRCTLGSEVSVAAGPVGAGGVLETEVHKRQAPIFTYMKSRGFYAGVQIDGTIIIERGDENERFYGQRLPVKDILQGKVRHPPFEIRRLLETLKAAQGDTDFDASVLPSEPPPGDYEVDNGQVFGVPDREDPDPYGVMALEKEGMRIVEAGSHKRASWEQFSFNPSPTSPVHSIYARSSIDHDISFSRRSSWRGSTMSNTSRSAVRPDSTRMSVDSPLKTLNMVDTSTQTEAHSDSLTPTILTWSNGLDRHSSRSSTTPSYRRMRDVPEELELTPPSSDKEVNIAPAMVNAYSTPPSTPPSDAVDSLQGPTQSEVAKPTNSSPMLQGFEVASPMSNPVMAKAKLVNVPKRIPPKLPPRNPGRFIANDSPPPSRPMSSSANDPESENSKDFTEFDQQNKVNRDSPHADSVKRSSKGSNSSSTWEKIRALRDEDHDEA